MNAGNLKTYYRYTTMGIPFYFRDIVQQNKGVLRSSLPQRCDRLYLDFNSVIHMSSQRVIAKRQWKDVEALEKAIYNQITQYTETIIDTCPPTQLLYIGIDGVAPLAKMVQQRKRRHLSALQMQLINEFKAQNNIPYTSWDSNCITPGTNFMAKLNIHLKSYYKAKPRSFEIVVSGPDEQGEGEHKIIKYIKDLGDNDPFSDVIYGLDADLIMLCLSCKKRRLYLMRETTQVTHQRGVQGYKYVDIDTLRSSVATHLYNKPDECFMLDYVCICFLLGNDFLPHNLALDIKHDGLKSICHVYRQVFEETKETLIVLDEKNQTYQINAKFLKTFLTIVASQEDDRIKKIISKHYDEPPRLPHVPSFHTPLDQFMHELNYMPILKRNKVLDPENDPAWKATYYHTLLQIMPSDIKAMDALCENFLQGIQWNVDYYFNNKFSHDWYYRYPLAPFVADIIRYMSKLNNDSLPSIPKLNLTMTPVEQLMVVLPHHSQHLLPANVIPIVSDVSSGVTHLYPTNFQVITLCKTQLWECIPILPAIEVHKVKAALLPPDSVV